MPVRAAGYSLSLPEAFLFSSPHCPTGGAHALGTVDGFCTVQLPSWPHHQPRSQPFAEYAYKCFLYNFLTEQSCCHDSLNEKTRGQESSSQRSCRPDRYHAAVFVFAHSCNPLPLVEIFYKPASRTLSSRCDAQACLASLLRAFSLGSHLLLHQL